MPLFSNVLGLSFFGFATRSLQLGIQKRPQFKDIKGHIGYMIAGAIIGYWLYEIEKKQLTIIKKHKKITEKKC
ncbi:hypothetical protein PORY_001781 [Pneumocystis oryctolagi]|uniref:Uncharacterized protein n=1 Tax=Pneumocystis oryctolagi TaxID=42067 RepID=A0ACB7CCQ3_9ASCO|nr:hypothetical protein PORY_001781 [Pneumocystis oryctolagi]